MIVCPRGAQVMSHAPAEIAYEFFHEGG